MLGLPGAATFSESVCRQDGNKTSIVLVCFLGQSLKGLCLYYRQVTRDLCMFPSYDLSLTLNLIEFSDRSRASISEMLQVVSRYQAHVACPPLFLALAIEARSRFKRPDYLLLGFRFFACGFGCLLLYR